ncbi:MAG TPA: hypothetical protein VFR02_10475 [bacterium]|nr:hypothetical protein [bacterium]
MKRHLRNIAWETWVFTRRNWFLVVLMAFSSWIYERDHTELVAGLSLTYIASFFFYVLTIYYPDRRNQRNMSRVVVPYLKEIVTQVKQVFDLARAGSTHACSLENPTDDDFFAVFGKIRPGDGSARLGFIGFDRWHDYLQHQRGRIERNLDKILVYEHFLETDFILELEKVRNSAFLEGLALADRQPDKHRDYAHLADPYFQCFRQMAALERQIKILSYNF